MSTRSFVKGLNNRLDELQAAVLRVKLRHLDADNERRRRATSAYMNGITNPYVRLPKYLPDSVSCGHLFVVRVKARASLIEHLASHGIGAAIHYPIPPHRQLAYSELASGSLPLTETIHEEVVSLPLSPTISLSDVQSVIDAVNAWSGSSAL